MSSEKDRLEVAMLAERLGLPEVDPEWNGVDAVFPLLDFMRSQGAVVLIKLDGERNRSGTNDAYTVAISCLVGERQGLRSDGNSVADALTGAILQFAEIHWSTES